MKKLLFIQASPSSDKSNSADVAKAFVEEYRHTHPEDEIEEINLWEIELPPFDAGTIAAKFAVLRKNEFTSEQHDAWKIVRTLSERFNSADIILFSIPMWNFGIPYVLKHYIDVVTLADLNWSWSKEAGYKGLLKDKRAVLVYSSAGLYPIGDTYDQNDFQKPYMKKWLSFIGITNVEEISVSPTLAPPEAVAEIKNQAKLRAQELARR